MTAAAGFVLGSAAISSPVAAQEARRLDIGISARAEHHSNVTRASASQAALRGLSRADTIFTPTVSVDALLPVGRQKVFLSGNVGYSFYEKNTRLNREYVNLDGGVKTGLGPCGVTVGGGYSRGVVRVDDPILIDNVENIQESKRVSLDTACSRGTGLGLTASVSKEWTDNDLPYLAISNSELSSAMVGVTYSRPTLGTVTLFTNRQKTEYPNRPNESGYDLTAVGVTYERKLGARIEGSVTVAYNNVDLRAPVVSGGGDVETTAYSAKLSYRASTRLRFGGEFSKSVTPASGFGRTYDLTTSYRLSGAYDLGSRIAITFGGGRVERDSEGLVIIPAIQLTNSTTDSIYGSLRYKMSERIALELSAGRDERTTNAPQFDYIDERIAVAVSSKF